MTVRYSDDVARHREDFFSRRQAENASRPEYVHDVCLRNKQCLSVKHSNIVLFV